MHFYRQSIILFGIAVPLVLSAVVMVAGTVAISKMRAFHEAQVTSEKAFERSKREANEIESKVVKDRPHLSRWNQQLSVEAASAISAALREIIEKLPEKEIQQTVFERADRPGGVGSASAQNSSQLKIGFRGTYRTLQRALLELESRKPQLVLQDLSIEPNDNSPSQVNLLVTYTAWEK